MGFEVLSEMKPRIGILAVVTLALGAPVFPQSMTQSAVQTREVLTNRAIVTLAGAGFNEDFIIELIANSRTQFDTSVNGLASLAKQGINERIIRVMLTSPAATQMNPEAQPVAASEAMAPPDPDARPRIMALKPRATTMAIATRTPYYGQTSVLWGLFRRKIGVGVAPQTRETLGAHLGLVYGAVLSPSGPILLASH